MSAGTVSVTLANAAAAAAAAAAAVVTVRVLSVLLPLAGCGSYSQLYLRGCFCP